MSTLFLHTHAHTHVSTKNTHTYVHTHACGVSSPALPSILKVCLAGKVIPSLPRVSSSIKQVFHMITKAHFASFQVAHILKACFRSQVRLILLNVSSSAISQIFHDVIKASFKGFRILRYRTSQEPLHWFSIIPQKPASRVFKSNATEHLKSPLHGLYNVSKACEVGFSITLKSQSSVLSCILKASFVNFP